MSLHVTPQTNDSIEYFNIDSNNEISNREPRTRLHILYKQNTTLMKQHVGDYNLNISIIHQFNIIISHSIMSILLDRNHSKIYYL